MSEHILKRLARLILEPFAKVFRSFFDPCFFTFESEITTAFSTLGSDIAATNATLQAVLAGDATVRDAITLTNARISSVEAYLTDAQAKLNFLLADIGAIRPTTQNLARNLALPSTTGQLSGSDAGLLNYAESHRGFRSRASLWFNPRDVVRYSPGSVELSVTTEHLIDVPFAISNVASLREVGASVLDVGCTKSLVPLEFASLGYDVTRIDLREQVLERPSLTTVAIPLEVWESKGAFDVTVCLSSIEHFGLGTYGEAVADDRHVPGGHTGRTGMGHRRRLPRPGTND